MPNAESVIEVDKRRASSSVKDVLRAGRSGGQAALLVSARQCCGALPVC